MLNTKHLAIFNVGFTAFAPGDDVVDIHFLKFVLCFFAAFDGADRADAFLAFVDQAFCSAVEEAEVEETLVTGRDILVHATGILEIVVLVEFLDARFQLLRVKVIILVLVIDSTPGQPLHI